MKRPFATIRERQGLTLARAAILTGYSESHLRAVEAGRAPLTEALCGALARAYGVEAKQIARPRPSA